MSAIGFVIEGLEIVRSVLDGADKSAAAERDRQLRSAASTLRACAATLRNARRGAEVAREAERSAREIERMIGASHGA